MVKSPSIWPPGQDLQVRGPDLQILRGTTRFGPVQGQGVSHTKVRKLWAGACHDQSPLPKETGSREQGEDVAHTSTNNETSQQEPGPHPTEKRMGLTDRTRSGTTALLWKKHKPLQGTNIEEPMEVSTIKQSKQTARKSIPRQNRKPEPVKEVSAPRQTTNAWTKPLRPITSGVSVGYVSEPDKTTHFRTIDNGDNDDI